MVPVHDNAGSPVGFVGIVEDVSERVKAEEQARQIERREAISELTAGLAHNLNNILAVVMGTAEQMLESLPEGHSAHKGAQLNLTASERAGAITRRLMVYAGQGATSREKVAVDTVVSSLATSFADTLPDSYTMKVFPGAPGAMAEVDKGLLEETLMELLTNARAACPGGGTIVVTTSIPGLDGEQNDRAITIAVSDNGAGMDERTHARAKEPFFTTREIGQGVGLGLSMADGFARFSGGSLRLDCTLGKGTVAELRLPLARQA